MADIKENEMQQVQDYNFLRVLDVNGNSVLISKEQNAKVLEGLMKGKSIFSRYEEGHFARTQIFRNIDVNSGEKYGRAMFYLVSTNSGSGDSTFYEFGVLRFGYDGNNVTKYIISGDLSERAAPVLVSATPEGFLKIDCEYSSLIFYQLF